VGLDAWQWSLDSERVRNLKSGVSVQEQPLPDATYQSAGLFGEDEWSGFDLWRMSVGGRADYILVENEANQTWDEGEEQEWSWNAQAGVTRELTRETSLKGIVGSGYRAASLSERYDYLDLGGGVTKYGNPELDPERSVFGEFGVDWWGSGGMWEFSVFHNELKDLISEQKVDASTIVNANVQEARIQGVELNSRWEACDWVHLYGNLAYAVGEDLTTDDDLADIPPLSGLVGMASPRGRGLWGLLETVFAARQDHTPEGVEEAAGWATLNARVGYDLTRAGLRQVFFVGGQNLADVTYRDYLTTWRGNTFYEKGLALQAGYQMEF
jgi:hemoglobin/transferrin/lactoferrin receptor protein